MIDPENSSTTNGCQAHAPDASVNPSPATDPSAIGSAQEDVSVAASPEVHPSGVASATEDLSAVVPLTAPRPPAMSPEVENSNIETSAAHSRKGKVARLPKALRDRLNWMMLDSIPYRQIIESLGPPARHLTENCLSTWKSGGHQDFLKEMRLLDEYRVRHELTLDLAREDRGIDVFQAAHKIAASLICQAVAEVGADTLRQAIQANPMNLLRMLNSLSRVTAGGLKCQSLVEAQAERASRLKQQQRPRGKKGLSKAVVKEMNDKLNLM